MKHDPHDLCIVIARELHLMHILIAHMTALADKLDGKAHCGTGLRVVGFALPVCRQYYFAAERCRARYDKAL